jgi:hypothetical protein
MKGLRLLPALALAAGSAALVSLPAAAAAPAAHDGHGHHTNGNTCTGTPTAPGMLAGSYTGNVTIRGVCLVNMGVATVTGNLTVSKGSALIAAFGLNDMTQSGSSSLSVSRNVFVRAGATLVLGCEPMFFPCFDDPGAATGPGTLTSNGSVGGSIVSTHALGVVVHASSVGRNFLMIGGGYGNSCTAPTDSPSNSPALEFWATGAKSAPYGDVEDVTVNGTLQVKHLTSCWLGLARDTVGRSVLVSHNTLNDPDAIEILANKITGNLACFGNTMVWNSSEASFGQTGLFPRTPQPNTVGRHRLGQCVLASPTTEGGPSGPGPF